MKSTSLMWDTEKSVFTSQDTKKKNNNNKQTKTLRYPYAGLALANLTVNGIW